MGGVLQVFLGPAVAGEQDGRTATKHRNVPRELVCKPELPRHFDAQTPGDENFSPTVDTCRAILLKGRADRVGMAVRRDERGRRARPG